eukprot:NODE_207_length_14754_cov_0.677994.p8 type:complete len:109 gc:universal NODE_207_length_14754_cov_0.677994:5522-5196(-)
MSSGLPISQINSLVKQVLETVNSDVNRTSKNTNLYLQQVLSYYLKYIVMRASEHSDIAGRKTIIDADVVKVLSTIDCMKDLLPETVYDQFSKKAKLETVEDSSRINNL